MANISALLGQILKAVYGKDVRQSIHDAISQCYDDVTSGRTLADEAAEKANTAAQQAKDSVDDAIESMTTQTNAAIANCNSASTAANNAASNASVKAAAANNAAITANDAAAALPVAAALTAAYDDSVTVVVDAGHGGAAHQSVEGEVVPEKEIVIAAVDEPSHGAQGGTPLRTALPHNGQSAVPVIAFQSQIQARGWPLHAVVMKHGAHSVNGAEILRPVQGVNHAAPAAHGKPRHGTASFRAAATVTLLNAGHKFVEEESLIGPAGYVKVALPMIPHVGPPGIGRHDYHLVYPATGREPVINILEPPFQSPARMVLAHAVKQIEHGVGACRVAVIGRRQQDVEAAHRVEHTAVHGVLHYAAWCPARLRAGHQGEQQQQEARCADDASDHILLLICRAGLPQQPVAKAAAGPGADIQTVMISLFLAARSSSTFFIILS